MLRLPLLLLILVTTTPLIAQMEVRGSLRAGYVRVSGFEPVEGSELSQGYAFGGEMLVARGPLGLAVGLDHYDAGEFYPRQINTVSLDAQYRFRMRQQRAVWVGLGRTIVAPDNDHGSVSVWAPSAGYSWPLGKRQLYVTARYHNASHRTDARFRPRDLNTTMLLFGIRSTNFLEW